MKQLPKLPYEYNSLEPYIDEQTMRLHHDKHHQAYVDKFNEIAEKYPELRDKEPEELLKDPSKLPQEIKQKVINFGGGHINHSFFWEILKKDEKLRGEIEKAINKKFGSFENFKKQFSESAASLFGSGYTWLVLNEKKELEILNLPNQDSPLSLNKHPLLAIDVWEHAYYLKYQNRRADWIENFFKIINWKKVDENYAKLHERR
jgi:Fe-Mn family superoxide dismutase